MPKGDMKTVILAIIFLISFSQIASSEEVTMKHSIDVPTQYSNGRNQEAFEGTSDIERYVRSYEKTWWAVMNKFAQDIKWYPRHDEFICSGTPAAAQGCIDGYEGAVKKVEAFLKDHAANEVQMFLKDHINK
jgi:hypothetical protein